jgi:hypothetical protein
MGTPKGVKIAALILFLAIVSGIGSYSYWSWRRSKESQEAYQLLRTVLRAAASSVDANEGFWVGDITEFYRMGLLPKEMAEADTAPIRPLVDSPRPYHGYFVVAMETAPSMNSESDEPLLLKGKTRSKDTFAICIYPALEGRPDMKVNLLCAIGHYRRPSDGNKPVLRWPTGKWRSEWAIVD